MVNWQVHQCEHKHGKSEIPSDPQSRHGAFNAGTIEAVKKHPPTNPDITVEDEDQLPVAIECLSNILHMAQATNSGESTSCHASSTAMAVARSARI